MSDMFTCCVCGSVSYAILDFLNHKAQHAAPGAGIHCEFCQISYARYITLKEHYRTKHKIVFSDEGSQNRLARSRQYKRRKKTDSEQIQLVAENIDQVSRVEDGFVVMEKKSDFDDIVNNMEHTSQQITNMQDITEKSSGLNIVPTGEGLVSTAVIIMTSHNENIIPNKGLDTHPISHLLESSTDANFNSSALSCDMPPSGTDIVEARLVQGPNHPHDHEEFLFNDQNAVHVVMERSNHDSMMTNGICSLMTTSDIQDKSSGLSQGYDDFNMTAGNVQLPYGMQHPGDLCELEQMDNDSSVHVIVEKSDSLSNHPLVSNGELMNLCSGDSNGNLISHQLDQTETELMSGTPLLDKSVTDDFHFILLTDLVEGSSITYGKQAFRCLHCEFQSCWKSGLCRHMREEHPETLSLHQAIQIKTAHTDSNRTVMKMSEYTAMQVMWKNKTAHPRSRGVEKQDLPGNFTCPKCDKVFNRLRYLRKHQIVHRTDQKFLCDECGKAFKTRAYLNQHRKIHKKEAYNCNQCDFTSSINTVIHEHRQIHNKGCVLCDVCGTAYFDKSTLAKHKSVHDMSRPFPCTYPGCTWRFRNEVMCRAHIRNHTTKGKFKCTICGYVFRHKHHLQRHEEKMHGIVIPKTWSKKNVEETKLDTVEEITDTVNLIVDPDISSDHLNLQNALHTNQLVIATDSEGNTINYEVADIAMNVAYQTLLAGTDGQSVDTHTILIPHQSNDCSHIVLQQETESITETVQ
ncbi:oocyte zinc finger protein XlCOF29-like [Mizuhopecten yessoensis]|uniref:Zinc finger protein 260 n=1 Tax=Mizuhopecten yessoensis TaxID=6573 RepID=A0A210QUW4_MIZYE|nr:oocyte zinc finger protein XlCOF29-like [Mizuhopecten yessoensis]OWF52563.1 Zinc finger protein 260 [Mizuhopecten yessoensis]